MAVKSDASPFFWQQSVYIEDTDAGGIVFYANYVRYMERARTEWLRTLGYKMSHCMAQGRGFVVHSMDMRYLKSARLDDVLLVDCQIKECKRATTVVFEQKITCEDQALCVGSTRLVYFDQQTGRPAAIPEALLVHFKKAANVYKAG